MEPVRCYMLLTASWTFWRRYSWRCHFHVHFDYLSQFRAIRSPLICIFTSSSSKCFQTLLSGCQVHVHLEKSLPHMQVIYEANFTTLLSIFLTFDQKGLNIEGTHCKNNFIRRKSKRLTTSCYNPLVILHGWYCILVFWHFQQQTWKFCVVKINFIRVWLENSFICNVPCSDGGMVLLSLVSQMFSGYNLCSLWLQVEVLWCN